MSKRLFEAEKFDPDIPSGYYNDGGTKPLDSALFESQRQRLQKHYTAHILAHGKPSENRPTLNPYFEYTTGSRSLNRHLVDVYEGHFPEVSGYHRDLHKNLGEAIRKAPPLPEHAVVYSALCWDRTQHVLKSIKDNDTCVFPAYSSTSLSFHSTSTFFKPQYTQHNNGIVDMNTHMAVFHVPRNSHGVAYIGSHSSYPDEHELLLNAGTTAQYGGTTIHPTKTKYGTKTITCHHFMYNQPQWAPRPHDGHMFADF